MSTVRRVPKSVEKDTNSSPARGSTTAAASQLLFVDPGANRVARHLEGAIQAAQTTTFLGGTQDFLPPGFGRDVRGRILAALATTGSTPIFLFTIWSVTILDNIRTTTVRQSTVIMTMGGTASNVLPPTGYHVLRMRATTTNRSEDILGLFCNTRQQLGISWTYWGPNIVIARRNDVELLDREIGPKS